MLIGHYESSLSEKNRVAVPKKFRSELGGRMIVAKWYEQCLVLISEEKWQGLMDKLTGKSEFVTGPVRDTDRFVLGSAFELRPDNQGRVVLLQSLVDYANLRDNVVFLGVGDKVEIWNKAKWEEREKYILENAGQMIEEIAKGGN